MKKIILSIIILNIINAPIKGMDNQEPSSYSFNKSQSTGSLPSVSSKDNARKPKNKHKQPYKLRKLKLKQAQLALQQAQLALQQAQLEWEKDNTTAQLIIKINTTKLETNDIFKNGNLYTKHDINHLRYMIERYGKKPSTSISCPTLITSRRRRS